VNHPSDDSRHAAIRRTVAWLVLLAGIFYVAFFVAMSLH
jgi:hypothetical protein